jgi:hypothetical protein
MPEETENTEEVNQAIEKLWSADDAERQEGKEAIIRLGSPAAEFLVALLEDLMENRHPRFPGGKESEGSKAIDRALEMERERQERMKVCEGPLNVAEVVAEALGVLKEVTGLAINSRLLF